MNQKEQIIAKILSLPTLPTVSSEVIRLVQDPGPPDAKTAKAIEYDPSMTTNVLRLANSAYFGFAHKVSTVKEALHMLGTDNVFQSGVNAAIDEMAHTPVLKYDLSGGDLWEHLIGTGIGLLKLAKLLNLNLPNYAFTAALTHDIGKVVLGTFVEVNAESVIALAHEEKIAFEQAEQRVFGIDHAEVGAFLLEHWNLPQSLVEVVRWHHRPEEFPGDPGVVNLVHVADLMCLMAGVGAGLDALTYRPQSTVMEQLGLKLSDLDMSIYEILNELLEIRKFFKFQ